MALDIVDQLVRSSAVDIIVLDSVAALVPRAELEGDMGDTQMGLQARLMSKALRKITGSLSKSQSIVIFINQLRSKIGVLYGSPEVTAGGNALKFYSSVRLDIRKKTVLADNAGITVRVKSVKNKVSTAFLSVQCVTQRTALKVATPFTIAEFDILFGEGIDRYGCLLDVATELKILEKKGSWYYKGDTKLPQGRRPAADYLRLNKSFADKLEVEVREIISSKKILPENILLYSEVGMEDDHTDE